MPIDTNRTKMIHIYAPLGGPYRIEIDRETRREYENGDNVAVAGGNRSVNVPFPAIAAAPLPGGPVTLATYEDLRALLASCADGFAEADEAAEAARLAALNPNTP